MPWYYAARRALAQHQGLGRVGAEGAAIRRRQGLGVLAALTVVSLGATIGVRPQTLDNYYRYPVTFIVPVGVLASPGGILPVQRQAQPVQKAFSSSFYPFFYAGGRVLGIVSDAAAGVDAVGVRHHAGAGDFRAAHAGGWTGVAVWHGAGGGLRVFVYSRFKGKVDVEAGGH